MLKLPGFASFATTQEVRAMPGQAAKVTITERQQDILRTIGNAPTASSQLRQRATIILLAFQRRGSAEIRQGTHINVRTIPATKG